MALALESAIVRVYGANGVVVGGGFLAMERQVLTCAHVVAQALGLPDGAPDPPRAELWLDFPLIAPERKLAARVSLWQPGGGDIAGLALEEPAPAGASPARLGAARELWGHPFRAFGFPAGYDEGVWASGVLRGPQAAGWLQLEDVKGTGYFIAPGFSGGPVWDERLEAVAGMIVTVETQPQVRAAFIIPLSLLLRAWPELERRLRPALPAQFQAFIDDKIEDFVGRDYVFAAIERFLAGQAKGYFTIEGDPGVGKSAILAEYVRRTGSPAHFNLRSHGVNSAGQFIESLCGQLITRYHLPYASLPAGATQDGAFLAQLLGEDGAFLALGERLVIAIDALDEVELAGHPSGANILYLPAALPEGVYFIMTRRQVALPWVVSAPQELFDLMAYHNQSRQDIQTYLRQAAQRPRIRDWIAAQQLAGQPLTPETFVTVLAGKSENNFMYLRYILPDIERGWYQNLSLDSLPAGLTGYYEDHWRRMGMSARPLPRPGSRLSISWPKSASLSHAASFPNLLKKTNSPSRKFSTTGTSSCASKRLKARPATASTTPASATFYTAKTSSRPRVLPSKTSTASSPAAYGRSFLMRRRAALWLSL